ncbi:MAG TPA: TSUP family transporter [Chitinophagaceae bacterium]
MLFKRPCKPTACNYPYLNIVELFSQLLMDIGIDVILLLCVAAFLAGFVDAIVGGGGLIQTPAILILLPSFPVATVIGTIKLPSFSGTLMAALQFLKKVKLQMTLVAIMCVVAFIASMTGSYLLTKVSNDMMKPAILIVLCIVAVYTFIKKNFGQKEANLPSLTTQIIYGIIISLVIGFYDGFIGPGAGSFLIVAFIAVLGYDFLHASAQAKMVNLATNLGSIVLFTIKGKILWGVAIPMAISNALGGVIGARLALKRGNKFIRVFFLFVVVATLMRLAYDVLLK